MSGYWKVTLNGPPYSGEQPIRVVMMVWLSAASAERAMRMASIYGSEAAQLSVVGVEMAGTGGEE